MVTESYKPPDRDVNGKPTEEKKCYWTLVDSTKKFDKLHLLGEDWALSDCCKYSILKAEYKYDGKWYCALHIPKSRDDLKALGEDCAEELLRAFDAAIKEKIEAGDLDFRHVYFPEMADFTAEGAYVEGSKEIEFAGLCDFSYAIFQGVDFSGVTFKKEALFRDAQFHHKDFVRDYFHATFDRTKFCGEVDFTEADIWGEVCFRGAEFHDKATFERSVFSKTVDFSTVAFKGDVDFSQSTFKDRVWFSGTDFDLSKRVDFRRTEVEDSAHFSFHSVALRPGWFINADGVREFDFTNVDWRAEAVPKESPQSWSSRVKAALRGWLSKFGDEKQIDISREVDHVEFSVKQEIEKEIENTPAGNPRLTDPVDSHRLVALRLMAKVCRDLASNAEANHRYGEASRFRYASMEAKRHAIRENRSKSKVWRGLAPRKVIWWYWLLSGYGERPPRALMLLLVTWLLFAAIYLVTGLPNEPAADPSPGHALVASFGAMTWLIEGPQDLDTAMSISQFAVFLEGVLGPLQIALFALALRRKVMN